MLQFSNLHGEGLLRRNDGKVSIVPDRNFTLPGNAEIPSRICGEPTSNILEFDIELLAGCPDGRETKLNG